jgi:DNA-binding NarL/FixJ family response regulator
MERFSTARALKVFLVEDSALVCERLATMIGGIAGATVVGRAARADEAVQAILETHPDAVVLDIKLAQGSGFDVLRQVRERQPEIEFLMLTNFATDPFRRTAERLGASGFFDKTTEFGRVREVLAARARSAAN